MLEVTSPMPPPMLGSPTVTSPPSHFSVPTAVTTAAVPQANTSASSPDSAPSFHSWIGTRRSSGCSPRSLASARIEERVTPSRIVPVSSGVTRRPSL